MLHKKLTRTLLGLTLVMSSLAVFATANVDQPAPAFSATGADGKTVSLDSYRGKTVVLEWTNADCPFVKKHYESGNIPKLQQEATAKGVVWLQVISSAPGKQGYVEGPAAIQLNKYRNAQPTATVLDADGKIGKLYGAQTTPHIFIVNAQGQLVYKGGIDSIPSADKADIAKADNYVVAALGDIAAGRKIANSSTKPYGCSVKYD
ncbi:MAG: alkyl hydroperoxide reductase [Verrucomicrobiaceae bacterium]|nr:alkyl hydroperoxide reductase [Verrucomicrobiaceae bacterium]